jgi:penicillin amidase
MVGREYPHVISQDFDSGYRAFRISEQLAEMDEVTEQDLLRVQLDVQTDFYRYYQELALSVIDGKQIGEAVGELGALWRYLRAWDGRAELDSLGLPVLVEFRRILADAVLSPFLVRCRELDPNFQYLWRNMDEPLRELLEAQAPELQPERDIYSNWKAFLLAKLKEAAHTALAACGASSIDKVTWGCVSQTRIEHPFSQAMPIMGSLLLNMPAESIPGCRQCVRLATSRGGASERMVVAPGHEASAVFHMPAGQSGHPLSEFYRDQHPNWVKGTASELLVGKTKYWLKFKPSQAP